MRAWIIPTIALLVIGGAGFGIGWTINEWRDDDSVNDDDVDISPSATELVEKTFSWTLKTAFDYEEAARRIGAFMRDFDCTGDWDEERKEGNLECDAGLTGFECKFKGPKGLEFGTSRAGEVICREGEQPPEGFPTCTVEYVPAVNGYLVRCSGPSTNAFCQVGRPSWVSDTFEVTCQRP